MIPVCMHSAPFWHYYNAPIGLTYITANWRFDLALVRIFGGTYINPDAVGMVEKDMSFHEQNRSTVTTIKDLTGSHVITSLSTKVYTGNDNTDKLAVKRDNFVHEEIVAAISQKRDAGIFPEV